MRLIDEPRDDSGFALVEVLVALVITTLGLVAVYSALSGHFQQTANIALRQSTFAYVSSQLDATGSSATLEFGTVSGTYPNGASWRQMAFEFPAVAGAQSFPARPVMVVIEAYDKSKKLIARVKSVQFAASPL